MTRDEAAAALRSVPPLLGKVGLDDAVEDLGADPFLAGAKALEDQPKLHRALVQALGCWHSEAMEGDGIVEEHVVIYEELRRLAGLPPRETGRGEEEHRLVRSALHGPPGT